MIEITIKWCLWKNDQFELNFQKMSTAVGQRKPEKLEKGRGNEIISQLNLEEISC